MIHYKRYWAWSFDGKEDHEVRWEVITQHIKELRHIDRWQAEQLSILVHLYYEPKTTLGDQLTLDYE